MEYKWIPFVIGFLEIIIVANSNTTDPDENPHVASTWVYIVCLCVTLETLGINGLTRRWA